VLMTVLLCYISSANHAAAYSRMPGLLPWLSHLCLRLQFVRITCVECLATGYILTWRRLVGETGWEMCGGETRRVVGETSWEMCDGETRRGSEKQKVLEGKDEMLNSRSLDLEKDLIGPVCDFNVEMLVRGRRSISWAAEAGASDGGGVGGGDSGDGEGGVSLGGGGGASLEDSAYAWTGDGSGTWEDSSEEGRPGGFRLGRNGEISFPVTPNLELLPGTTGQVLTPSTAREMTQRLTTDYVLTW
jgi:hypothetical protein